MNLSSTARSVVVAAAVAATAGFGVGAAFSSHPRRLTPEMRRQLDGRGSTTASDATTWRRADGTVHEVTGASSGVRMLPHDVKGP